MPLPYQLTDCYGQGFLQKEIRPDAIIDLTYQRSLHDFSEEEIRSSTVLIDDPDNGKKLYLLSDLKYILKTNHYARVVDPITRTDLIEKIPAFKKVVSAYEQQAANYNAYILNQYPQFIPLLKIYVEEILAPADAHQYRNADITTIHANNSSRLVNAFYGPISRFNEAERAAFHSLFITNRQAFHDDNLLDFPVKWVRTEKNAQAYDYYVSHGKYTPYPFRNVIIGETFDNPEAACMHSWGMDILHLLLQYHIGTNRPFTVFNDLQANPYAYKMEQTLRNRIEQQVPIGSLDPSKGADARRAVEKFVAAEGNGEEFLYTPTEESGLADTPNTMAWGFFALLLGAGLALLIIMIAILVLAPYTVPASTAVTGITVASAMTIGGGVGLFFSRNASDKTNEGTDTNRVMLN